MTRIVKLPRKPIFWVLLLAAVAALLVFQDFGLTWDEPLFYEYADALGYAYTPSNWLSATFDLSQSYGPSAEDHKTRGPGYLLLARVPVGVLERTGLPNAAAWHLVNLATFLLGVHFVYQLGRWIADEGAAAAGAALFASQPLLWGHAFINPKDIPFMVLLSGAIWLGIRMVEVWRLGGTEPWHRRWGYVAVASVFLGLATSNRVLGPLGALLVLSYWLAGRPTRSALPYLSAYLFLAALTTFATWPYLWENPGNIARVFGLMAQNPTVLPVLFAGTVFRANQLPLRYLPFYLTVTLTEPAWPLLGLGLLNSLRPRSLAQPERVARIALLLAWLLIPVAYVLAARPPMYDGMRHFLFVLPPVFALGAAGWGFLLDRLGRPWARLMLAVAIVIPGILGILRLHPYEYTYFNSWVGGTGGAFRRYETDYWLTCYKESVERFNGMFERPVSLFVHREAAAAAPYAAANVKILEERDSRALIASGDFVLINTRTNEDLYKFRDAPEILAVGRLGATYCLVKRIP